MEVVVIIMEVQIVPFVDSSFKADTVEMDQLVDSHIMPMDYHWRSTKDYTMSILCLWVMSFWRKM